MDVPRAVEREAATVYGGIDPVAMLRCLFEPQQVTVQKAIDAGLVIATDFSRLTPDPDFVYPPNGKRPSDEGFRVYLADERSSLR